MDFADGVSMTKELRQSQEKLQRLVDMKSALAGWMAELLELREAVRTASARLPRRAGRVDPPKEHRRKRGAEPASQRSNRRRELAG